ncbi:MAG TPA: hypothetical protein VEP73_01925 [Actinomycetota bacterium]|nr:hypothetical protein [Actinomycetota bacterium]
MTGRELERALADLGAHLEHPATPPVAEAVAARLAGAPAPADGRGRRPPARPRWRRLAVACLVIVLLAIAVLAASPATREAAARLFGLRGVRIQLGGPAGTAPPTSPRTGPATTARTGPGAELHLGTPASLAQARALVRFPVAVPTAPGFEHPDAVYVDPGQPADGRVDLVYLGRPGLPASPDTGVGLLVTQFRAGISEEFVKKVQMSEGGIEAVTVHGGRGYWFAGRHDFAFVDRHGNGGYEVSRVAGSTLVWERGDVTLRLEGQVSKQEALRIAESMR